jgi:class 3 adenylate cyclase
MDKPYIEMPLDQSVNVPLMVERYVAFVDILGFKDEVERAEKSGQGWPRIMKALSLVRNCLCESPLVAMKISTFSDCIIMSAERSREGLLEILHSVEILSFNLVQHDLLMRGGLDVGNVFHDTMFVFGSAVNRAYKLESSEAIYPMTQLSEDVMKDIDRLGVDASRWLREDGPQRWFVHYLHTFESFDPRVRVAGTIALTHPAARIREFVRRRLCKPESSPRKKAQWMADYWNRTVASRGVFLPIELDMPALDALPGPTEIYRAVASSSPEAARPPTA